MGTSTRDPIPDSATTTATSRDDSSLQRRSSNGVLGHAAPSTVSRPEELKRKTTRRGKYRHVEAYHSELRHSSLGRDSGTTTNFLGFRNLMVIVLGRIYILEIKHLLG